jgi:thioredoxin reductase
MHSNGDSFDAAIIGGGPAGLSAAIVLGRACRRVVLFDHGKPRNYAARAVHNFLGLDGLSPTEVRARGEREAAAYGVEFRKCEVTSAARLSVGAQPPLFKVTTNCGSVESRALLLATGVVDDLPQIPGVQELYGRRIHHCPYCDAWEHRGKHLIVFGDGSGLTGLALTLRAWADHVTVCSNGQAIDEHASHQLAANRIELRRDHIKRFLERDSTALEVGFEDGPLLLCEAAFFSAGQQQRSALPISLGCEIDKQGLIRRDKKQMTCIQGVFVAGDAAGEVQLAVVAAAEGVIAAIAINKMLSEQSPN